jgi:hypothetical protein
MNPNIRVALFRSLEPSSDKKMSARRSTKQKTLSEAYFL